LPSGLFPDRPVRADDEAWGYWDPWRWRAARRARQGRSRLSSPGPFPSGYKAPSMWHPARWSAEEVFPPPRTSAIGYKHPPACSTPPLPPDSGPAPSETARRLPAGGTYRDTALRVANVLGEAWDPVPPPSLRIPPQRRRWN